MPHCFARIFEPLLRLLRPAPGRHRRRDHQTAGFMASTVYQPRASAAPGLRGEQVGLVRPYLVAHERREAQRQRARRRALWLAVHGIDIGPRLLHGVEVSA
ncbi:hypothetical protein GCM10020367_65510 [Streptomyces sannanensis]|uniref:Uncharacterized protein n=1 Tax=Streptomyces sannanensis TaxID=285536 RepID=A0ABP6S459_9ACTN